MMKPEPSAMRCSCGEGCVGAPGKPRPCCSKNLRMNWSSGPCGTPSCDEPSCGEPWLFMSSSSATGLGFSRTEMLTTAGITFFTSGAKLGVVAAAATAGWGAVAPMSAQASGAATARPTHEASAATRTRRYADAFGLDWFRRNMTTSLAKRGCAAALRRSPGAHGRCRIMGTAHCSNPSGSLILCNPAELIGDDGTTQQPSFPRPSRGDRERARQAAGRHRLRRRRCPCDRDPPFLLRRGRLRAQPPAIVLDRENVAVEGRRPALALNGHLKITESVADIALDLVPIELRIAIDHVGRTLIAELFVDAIFDQFTVECIQLAQVERIAQLTDQIACPDQCRLRVGSGAVFLIRNGKARELDGRGNALLVDERNRREALTNHDLRSLHVIGHEIGVRGAARGSRGPACGVDHEVIGRIAGTDAADISDVVGQCGQNGVSPIAGRHDPLEAAATENVLDAKGDQSRVFAVMIERVAAGNALYDEPGGLVQSGRNARLLIAIDPAVGAGQIATQCVSQKACRVQHHYLLSPVGEPCCRYLWRFDDLSIGAFFV